MHNVFLWINFAYSRSIEFSYILSFPIKAVDKEGF